MRPTRFQLASMIVAAVAAVLAIVLHQDNARQHEKLEQLRRRSAQERAAAEQRVAGVRRLSRELTGAEGLLARVQRQEAGQPPVRNPNRDPRTMAEMNAIQRKRELVLRRDPELQLLYAKRTRGFIVQANGPFFVKAGLTADTIERFVAAAVDYEMQLIDLAGAAAELGSESEDAVKRLRARAKAERDQAFQEILGEQDYRHYQEYKRVEPLRAFVGRIAGQAVESAVPLSATDAEAVVAVLASASPVYQQGGTAQIASVNWGEAWPQLTRMLTPAQLAVLFPDLGEAQFMSVLNAAVEADKAARIQSRPPGGT